MSKIVMGMMFADETAIPDFGSIYRVENGNTVPDAEGVYEYGGNATDVAKLSLLTNAACGSTCLMDDTGDIYRKTKSGWVKFGGT